MKKNCRLTCGGERGLRKAWPAEQPDSVRACSQMAGGHRVNQSVALCVLQQSAGFLSRADRIRTCDLFVPNEARYQPALQLDVVATQAFYTN